MKRSLVLLSLLASSAWAQIIPSNRLITWQGNVGVNGGIPARTTIFQSLSSGATMAQIQSALNSCPSGQTVFLGAGTYQITGQLVIPSNVTLRGAGRTATILNATGAATGVIRFGSEVQGEYSATFTNINSGYTKGSNTIVVASASGIAVGSLLIIDQLNDASLPVSNVGTYGTINWNSRASGTRAFGQTVEVTGISGTTITFSPALYHTYSAGLTPQAGPITPGCQMGGVESLQVFGNNTGYDCNFYLPCSKNCWIKDVESNYADGDHVRCWFGSFRCEIRDSYFHDAFSHTSGTSDACVMIANKSSSNLIENNILYRLHVAVMMNWGASGNVIAYNYVLGEFDSGPSSLNVMMYGMNGNHGAHPSYNLFEGNIAGQYHSDSYWGSSSNSTIFRNWWTGDVIISQPYTGRGTPNTPHHATQGLRAQQLDFAQSSYNVVGNVIGSTYGQDHDIRQVIAPAARNYQDTLYLYSWGYSDVSDGGGDALDNARSYNTRLEHGNYDFVTGAQVWDPTISDHNLPNSYYLPGKPAFFGNLTWPPINPASPTQNVTIIPAGYRFVNGVDPPPSGADTTPPTMGTAVISSSGTTITLPFSEAVQAGSGGTAGWTLLAGGSPVAMSAFSGAGSASITYTLSPAINFGQSVTIAYAQPGNGIEDVAGNDLAGFSARSVTNNSTQGQTVAVPVITLTAGTYTSAQSTTITCATPGAAIHYTTDGSAPTLSSPTYVSAVSIPSSLTLRAIGTLSGWNNSAPAGATYVINLPTLGGARYIGIRGVPAAGGAVP